MHEINFSKLSFDELKKELAGVKFFKCVERDGREDPPYAITVLKGAQGLNEGRLYEWLRAFFPNRVCDHKHAKFDNLIFVRFSVGDSLTVRLEAFREWGEQEVRLIPQLDRFVETLGLQQDGLENVGTRFFDPAENRIVEPTAR